MESGWMGGDACQLLRMMKTFSRFLIPLLFLLLFAGLGWQQWELARLRADLKEFRNQPSGLTGPDASASGPHLPGARRNAVTQNAAVPAGAPARSGNPLQARQAIKSSREQAEKLLANEGGAREKVRSSTPLILEEIPTAQEDSPADTAGLDVSGLPSSWSHRQAAGPPDTPEAGDFRTAWAPRTRDGGQEWLKLKYPQSTEIASINIHETYNPGAVSKVTARLPDGSEKVIWEGVEPAGTAPVEATIQVPPGVHSDQITIHLDTSRVSGWNEIDAVEIIGRNGKRQWAEESSASSYYGDQWSRSAVVGGFIPE